MKMGEGEECKTGGGNDISYCVVCGVEYDWRKQPRPKCPRAREK